VTDEAKALAEKIAAEVWREAATEVRHRAIKAKGLGAVQLAADLETSFRARADALALPQTELENE